METQTPYTTNRKNILSLIKKYYELPGNVVGGNLHIVLDDGNMETRHIESCEKRAIDNGDKEGIEIVNILLQTDKAGRDQIYNAYWNICDRCRLCGWHNNEWAENKKCQVIR